MLGRMAQPPDADDEDPAAPPRPRGRLRSALKHLQASDLRGVARLATQATLGVSRIAEGVHQSVLGTLGAPGGAAPGQARGLTGLVYGAVRGGARLVGWGADQALAGLEPWLQRLEAPGGAETPERVAVLAALNGVMGDQLAATGNPLALPMTLRCQGRVLPAQGPWPPLSPLPGGRLLLLIHGLCMNELLWAGGPADFATALAEDFGCTPVHLRYNTGLHTSQNGQALAVQLQALVARWPVPVQSISVLAHSMGGLVMRSACEAARQQGLGWLGALRHIVFLGTPHHGAPLERAGHGVDLLLASTPWTAPFARLGQLRSAGITDLRYGHVLDADWQGRDRFRRSPDRRTLLPLPEGVACFTVAATLAARRSPLADRLVGDGLVPLRSALGQHDDPARTLHFPPERQWLAYRMGHLELLHRPEVLSALRTWLGPLG